MPMKLSLFSRQVVWSAVIAIAGGRGLALRADDGPATRASLKFQVDGKPIDRDSFDRVSYASVLKKAAPSVVNVSSTKKVSARQEDMFNDPMFRRFFGMPEGGGGGGRSQTQHSLGSGVIVSSDGY